MNLENIAGCSINRAGGIDGAGYTATGLRVSNYGNIYQGYTRLGNINSSGQVRSGAYGTNTGVGVTNGGNFCSTKTW